MVDKKRKSCSRRRVEWEKIRRKTERCGEKHGATVHRSVGMKGNKPFDVSEIKI